MDKNTIIAAPPTGFTKDGELDLVATEAILNAVNESGIDTVFVVGSSGEFPSLDRIERRAVARLSTEVLTGIDIVFHVGSTSVHQTRQNIEDARELGATSVAVITPYYVPPYPGFLFEYFESIDALTSGLDVYVYVFTDRTGLTVSPTQLAEIASLPNIVGAKVSGAPLSNLAAYRAVVPPDFSLLTGKDDDLAKTSAAGVQGVVSGVAAAFPRPFLELRSALDSGDAAAISRAQRAVDEVVQLIAGNPARVKAALRLRGIPAGYSRMPFEEPDNSVMNSLQDAVARHC